jgi:uncharacterized SAM-binding protein YcdF (DUF218 family)
MLRRGPRRDITGAMFILSKVFWLLVSPGSLIVILLCLGIALSRTRRRRAGQAAIGIATVTAVLVAVLPIGEWLTIPLENRFPPPAGLPEKIDGIIVLGGAVQQVITAYRGQPSLNGAAERMTEFVAMARRHPEARLVYSGGSGLVLHPELKEVVVARALFASLGLDVTKIAFEGESRNTYENATFTRDLMHPKPGEIWVLITSAFHMPRAYGSFSRAGWKVIPYPVDYITTGRLDIAPDFSLASGLGALDFAIHEWVGLLAYRVLGRSDAFFPGPPHS